MTENEKFFSSVRKYADEYDINTLIQMSENGKNLTPLFAAVCIASEKGLGITPSREKFLKCPPEREKPFVRYSLRYGTS